MQPFSDQSWFMRYAPSLRGTCFPVRANFSRLPERLLFFAGPRTLHGRRLLVRLAMDRRRLLAAALPNERLLRPWIVCHPIMLCLIVQLLFEHTDLPVQRGLDFRVLLGPNPSASPIFCSSSL